MKETKKVLGIALALTLLISLPAASAQKKVMMEKTLTGEIVRVNAIDKIVTVKDSEGRETMFNYTNETMIVTPDETPQGLTGKDGAKVLVTYHEENGSNWANRIELKEP